MFDFEQCNLKTIRFWSARLNVLPTSNGYRDLVLAQADCRMKSLKLMRGFQIPAFWKLYYVELVHLHLRVAFHFQSIVFHLLASSFKIHRSNTFVLPIHNACHHLCCRSRIRRASFRPVCHGSSVLCCKYILYASTWRLYSETPFNAQQRSQQLTLIQQTCVGGNLGGCNAVDVGCICRNSNYISELSCCVSSACSPSDVERTYPHPDPCGSRELR